ncbi:Septin-7, partial [Nibea albiflora]
MCTFGRPLCRVNVNCVSVRLLLLTSARERGEWKVGTGRREMGRFIRREAFSERNEGGESGLGKSTLINSLFLTDLYSKDYPGPSQRIKKTVQV